MKPLNGLFFLMPFTITVLAEPYTNEDAGIGPDGVKCTLSTVSVKHPNDLLTFDNGQCVYSTSTDQCKTGVALFQYYNPRNMCPQGMSYCACFIFSPCGVQPLRRQDIEILSGQNPSQAMVPCCVHIECGDKGEGTCVNTPDTGVGDCKGELRVSVLPWKYRSVSSNQLMLCQGRRSMPRGDVQNHVLHTLPEGCEHKVHHRTYDSGRSGNSSIPGRAPPR